MCLHRNEHMLCHVMIPIFQHIIFSINTVSKVPASMCLRLTARAERRAEHAPASHCTCRMAREAAAYRIHVASLAPCTSGKFKYKPKMLLNLALSLICIMVPVGSTEDPSSYM